MKISKFLLILLSCCLFTAGTVSAQRKVRISGEVFEDLAMRRLIGAKVLLIDGKGNEIDSVIAGGVRKSGNISNPDETRIDSLSQYIFSLPVDSLGKASYTLFVSFPGYEDAFHPVEARHIETYDGLNELPPIVMHKKSVMLEEVTVKATKLKFYNKGDTLVYNADAFELANGAMLDQLIRQLPGVEMRDNGQIFVNGRYVESLMLNGRFISGDKTLLLDNLAAFTVKDIAVYEKKSDLEEFLESNLGQSQYVMDVRMKKQFFGSYMLNLEAGYGTDNKYLGRLFALRSTSKSQISILANLNNVNDSRKPGERTAWTPDKLTSGIHQEKLAGANYAFNSIDRKTWKFEGSTVFRHSAVDDEQFTDRTWFLSGGDNYGYTFMQSDSWSYNLTTEGRGSRTWKRVLLSGIYTFEYNNNSSKSRTLEGVFDESKPSISNEYINDILTGKTSTSGLVNASLNADSIKGANFRINASGDFIYKIPKSSLSLNLRAGVNYKTQRPQETVERNILYGDKNADPFRNYDRFSNYPSNETAWFAELRTPFRLGSVSLEPTLNIGGTNLTEDSRMYSFMPHADSSARYNADGWVYVPENSYHDNLNRFSQFLQMFIIYFDDRFMIQVQPQLQNWHLNYNYSCDEEKSRKRIDKVTFRAWGDISYSFSKIEENKYKNKLRLEFNSSIKLPDVLWLSPFIYTANPLIIMTGAETLKMEQDWNTSLSWTFTPRSRKIMETLKVKYSMAKNALDLGYIYDTSTGVRTMKGYNVNGNYDIGVENFFNVDLNRITLSSNTSFDFIQAVNMTGTNAPPAPYKIRNRYIGEKLSLAYIPASWIKLTGQTDLQWRRTRSFQEGFSPINAFSSASGITALFTIQGGFQIATDITYYSRNGYGNPNLDSHNWVWNGRVSWTSKNKQWLLALDGFDILHQLNSIQYSVNAQGRTVSYLNVMPRYAMLHVQYRINITPSKR